MKNKRFKVVLTTVERCYQSDDERSADHVHTLVYHYGTERGWRKKYAWFERSCQPGTIDVYDNNKWICGMVTIQN